jgi:hypothetical protein
MRVLFTEAGEHQLPQLIGFIDQMFERRLKGGIELGSQPTGKRGSTKLRFELSQWIETQIETWI